MRKLVLSFVFVLGLPAFAQSDFGLAKHSIYGAFGFTPGGMALGADYEYLGLRDFGIGGYVRIYQKDDETPNTDHGYTTFGAFIRPHFTKKSWDFYVSPGIAIVNIDALNDPPGDTTSLGASFALGLMYEITNSAALGVENMGTWVWFDEDWRGQRIDDLMLRFRLSF